MRWKPSVPGLFLAACLPLAALWANGANAAEDDRGNRAAAAFSQQPTRVALLIGVSEFHQSYQPLAFTSNDVVDVALALLDPTVGDFDELRIVAQREAVERSLDAVAAQRELEGTKRERILDAVVSEPTRAGVQAELEAMASRGFATGSLALVYVSSHGDLLGDDQYLVVSDTEKATLEHTGLELATLRETFRAIDADQRMLIKAFCHSGFRTAKGQRPWVVGQVESEVSASTMLGVAQEDLKLENDLYTYFFVEALSRSEAVDINRDGAVSDLEAHGYAVTRLVQEGASQRPTLTRHQVLDTPLVLAGKAGQPELASLISGWGDVLDYAFTFVRSKGGAEATQVEDAAQVVMEPGCYKVSIRDPKTGRLRYQGPVCMSLDENVILERLVDRQERFSLRLAAGARIATNGELKDELMGGGPVGQLLLGVPWRGPHRVRWMVDLGVAGGFHAGEREVFGATYDSRSWGVTPTLALRYLVRYPLGDVSLGPLVGYHLGRREYPLEEGSEAVPVESLTWLAPLTGARLNVDLTPGYSWIVGLSADLWVFGVSIDDDVKPRVTTHGGLHVGYRF